MATHGEVVRLLIECRTDLFAFILATLRDYNAAEEVMQNVAVVICDKADQYQTGTGFGAWSREIARRQVLQFMREDTRRPSTLAPADVEYLAAAFDEAEQEGLLESRFEALRACLAVMSQSVRQLIRLRYEDRLSLAQMALRTGLKADSVRKALYRGRIALRKCIDRRLAVAS